MKGEREEAFLNKHGKIFCHMHMGKERKSNG
jgi:hypothetical protein